MKILLISNRFKPVDNVDLQHEFKQFLDATLDGSAATTVHTYYDKLIFTISDGEFSLYDTHNNQPVSDIDVVFYRGPWLYQNNDCAYYVSRYCQSKGIICINDYSAYYPGTKFAQNIVFMDHKAPILKCLYSIHKQELIVHAQKTFGYPYILKTNKGSHGDSNYLVNSREQAISILKHEPEVDFLAQAYCHNDRDYRVLLIGSKQLIIERKGGADTHLNNTSKGATAIQVRQAIPSDLIKQAQAIMKTLGLTIAGVDIIKNLDDQKMYFLEINSQPQIRTGALLAEKKQTLRAYFDSL